MRPDVHRRAPRAHSARRRAKNLRAGVPVASTVLCERTQGPAVTEHAIVHGFGLSPVRIDVRLSFSESWSCARLPRRSLGGPPPRARYRTPQSACSCSERCAARRGSFGSSSTRRVWARRRGRRGSVACSASADGKGRSSILLQLKVRHVRLDRCDFAASSALVRTSRLAGELETEIAVCRRSLSLLKLRSTEILHSFIHVR